VVLARLLTIALLLSSPVARTSATSVELEADESAVVVSATALLGRPAVGEVPPRQRLIRRGPRVRCVLYRRRTARAAPRRRPTPRRGIIHRAVLYDDGGDDDDDQRG